MEHKCNKEAEIGIITVKIENIEKSVDETKQDVKDLHKKMDNFISSANSKFATKKELYFLIPICGLAVIGLLVINNLL